MICHFELLIVTDLPKVTPRILLLLTSRICQR